ncbi:hypothetical protein ALQ55_101356 [Pseudomonas savastanoi pv. savastanoi]|nr:hypothetical protein ALQ55_101356 [Pseudomonas savastanoi pv. savastanoi]
MNISSHDWDNRPYDPLDSLVLNRWAFSKAGWVLRNVARARRGAS